MKYKIITFLFCLLVVFNISINMNQVNVNAVYSNGFAIENGKLKVESDMSVKSDSDDRTYMAKNIRAFINNYKKQLTIVSSIATLSGILGITILLIKLSALGDNSWIVRRNIIIALGVCGVVTAILGSFTLYMALFRNLLAG